MRNRVWAATALVLAAAAAATPVYAAYQHDIRAARQRIGTGSAIAQTACGPIEYAEAGSGRPFLAIHGTGGGFDQGLLAAKQAGIDLSEYRVIAPSRFGYLRTPLPHGDTSPAAEADAHACLLDALGITEPVVVEGVSAGALSAMQLAIRHPDRVSALLLMVPAAWSPPDWKPEGHSGLGENQFVMNVVLRSDFAMWAFMKAAGADLAAFVGVSKEVQATMTAEDRANVTETLDTIQPVSRRYQGILKDAANHEAKGRYDLERITAPTLVVDAKDMETFPGARYTAEHIPRAQLFAFETGGHLLIGRGPAARAAIAQFLSRN